MSKFALNLITSLVVGLIFAFGASASIATAAPSSVQQGSNSSSPEAVISMADGRCGFESHDVDGFYQSLKREGVLDQAVREVFSRAGYSRVDGSLLQWMRDRLIITRTQQVVTIKNYGCRNGVLFGAGPKTLPKGWPIVVVLPSKYSKSDISTKPKRGYTRTTLRCVLLVGQASCDNPGLARCVLITVWVKVRKPTPKPKKYYNVYLLKKVVGGSTSSYFNFRSTLGGKTRTVKARAGKKIKLGKVKYGTRGKTTEFNIPSGWKVQGSATRSFTVRGNLTITYTNKWTKPSTPPPPPAKCQANQIEKVNQSGQIVCTDIEQGGICTSNNVQVGGGNSNNTNIDCSTRIEVKPPPPPDKPRYECPPGSRKPWPICEETPPERVASAQCVSLEVENSLVENLLVNATVTYQATNARLREISYYWGDSSPPTVTSSLTASHRYARASTYTIYAVLTFDTWDGGTTSATCADRTITPKDGSRGQGSDTPGQPGGPGSGGDPGDPDNGDVCRDPNTGNIRTGRSDQFGFCV